MPKKNRFNYYSLIADDATHNYSLIIYKIKYLE